MGSECQIQTRTDYDSALADYDPPSPDDFNWALDWFDHVGSNTATDPHCPEGRQD